MESTKGLNSQPQFGEASTIDYGKIILRYSSKWYWFLISVVVFSIISYGYIKYSSPMFRVSARILVNDDKKGGALGANNLLGDLGGLLGGKSTVDNEAEILKSKDLLERVINDLQLNITYKRKSFLKYEEINSSPFVVMPVSLDRTFSKYEIRVSFGTDYRVHLTGQGLDTVINLNSQILIPNVGLVKVLRNEKVLESEGEYAFTIESVNNRMAVLAENLQVVVANKSVTIIDLNLNTPNPDRGVLVLNSLISNYVQQTLNDKNEIADSTIAFIKRRLLVIGSDLENAEGNIQGFKQRRNLADMTEQGKLLITTSGQYASELGKVETQISIINNLLEYLKDSSKNKRVLPSTLMPADMVLTGIIDRYNSLLLERGRMLIGLSENNPVIINLNTEIENLRKDIQSNLNSTLSGLIITRDKLSKQVANAEGQIQQVPETERNYLKLARQQQIKQELYLFLMQKSEETAISKTANIANSKVIDSPRSEINPYSPKPKLIYLGALLLGLSFPVFVFYLKDLLNVAIDSKDDIVSRTNAPIIGEIGHNFESHNLVISQNERSALSEQFRALRTNLSFYLKDQTKNVILLTSSMPGEGKSFTAINLGHILAVSGKRVLLMELDLRKPALASKMNVSSKIGFTNFIMSNDLSIDDIIVDSKVHSNLFLIASGPIPPNPSENLLDEKVAKLFADLRQRFDYIIIDSPPIGIVTDAQLLGAQADLCLYVVRQKITRKEQINIVEDLYASRKMNNIAVVVNDIEESKGYGYGYGYGYGSYGSFS